MGDKDDFKRDFEEEDQAGTETAEDITGPGQGSVSGDETSPKDPMQKKGGSSTRILLLVLLLAVLVAAGYFYFGQDLMGPSQTQPKAEAEPRLMPVPQRQQAAPAAQEAGGEAAAEKTAAKPAAQPVPPRPEEAAKQKAAEPEQAQQDETRTAKTEQPAQQEAGTAVTQEKAQGKDRPQPASEETVAAGQQEAGEKEVAEKTGQAAESAVEVTKKAAAPVKSPGPQAQDVQKEGKYILQAGAFVLYPNLVAAQEKVRRLGYEPVVKPAVKETEVTRLRVGTFFPNQGEAKIAELKALGAEPFFFTDGDLMVVYAGTFYRQDRARRFAERLAEDGIHVEEENIVAELPLSILRFGDFASREQALEAAEKARAAGLEVLLVKRG